MQKEEKNNRVELNWIILLILAMLDCRNHKQCFGMNFTIFSGDCNVFKNKNCDCNLAISTFLIHFFVKTKFGNEIYAKNRVGVCILIIFFLSEKSPAIGDQWWSVTVGNHKEAQEVVGRRMKKKASILICTSFFKFRFGPSTFA